jgi:ABC-type glycerol-3-phosphate transport system permease component
MSANTAPRLTRGLLIGVAVIISVLAIFPVYWMLVSSFRPQSELFSTHLNLLPRHISLEHYIYAFSAVPLLRILGNTLFVAASRTVLSLFLCSLAGFAFSKLRFRGRKVLFLLLLFTMTIPFEAIIIPSFIIVVRLHWVNTYYPLIVPMAASAFGIFFMRQYVNTIPDELIQAAVIDGCGYFRIYRSVILPVTIPAIITLSIFIFKLSWNDFIWPLIVIRKTILDVMMVAIQSLPPPLTAGQARDVPWGATMAASFVSVIPLLVIFFALQRYFVSGATQGSIK